MKVGVLRHIKMLWKGNKARQKKRIYGYETITTDGDVFC